MSQATKKDVHSYSKKIGREVAVHFLDGKVLKGKLAAIFKYEIVLEIKKDKQTIEVTIFKSAVKYII